MFENDRFGPGVDYTRTYQELGGSTLAGDRLREVMDELVQHMFNAGRNPRSDDRFPSVSEVLHEIPVAANLNPGDISLIEELVALHEVGSISVGHAKAVQSLAMTHRLGIVSNIWGRKNVFERHLEQAGILGCFEHRIWSSDHGCIKPSPKLFLHALASFNVPPSKVLFVGDHPYRDIQASRACGCSTVWIQNDGERFPQDCSPPDLIIPHLEDLLKVSA